MSLPVSDDVKRLHDGVALHFAADQEQALNSWVAVALADGKVSELFDTRADAVRHQSNEALYFYIQLVEVMSLKEAETVLRVNRQFARAGMRLADPEREVVLPMRQEHLPLARRPHTQTAAQIMQMIANVKPLLSVMSRADRRYWEREIRKAEAMLRG